jgi:hypothetical protein
MVVLNREGNCTLEGDDLAHLLPHTATKSLVSEWTLGVSPA